MFLSDKTGKFYMAIEMKSEEINVVPLTMVITSVASL